MKPHHHWPVLRTYDQNHLARIALPLGGIGTGTVSLGGRGDLRAWEIVNRPAKNFIPRARSTGHSQPPFFALHVRGKRTKPCTRLLEGPLEMFEYEGEAGSPAPNHGLPRFRHCRFAAAYPLGQVILSDPAMPVSARIEAFNPLIPGDAERSGLPVAVLRFVICNRSDKTVTASICGSMPNFVGADGATTERDFHGRPLLAGPKANRNTYREDRHVRGLFMDSAELASTAETWGSLALTTTAAAGISYRTAWRRVSWGDALLDFWDDFSDDGVLDERQCPDADDPMASLAVTRRIAAGKAAAVTFLLTWHFPNRRTWTPKPDNQTAGCSCAGACDPDIIGNYYATRHADAWAAAETIAAQLPRLERDTVTFVEAFCRSDLPESVKEAALFNLSTLRSQTCFRTPDGRLYGWEGCNTNGGCCYGSCTHVWNYEQATAFLFGDLACTMREVEFAHATDDHGRMSFRVHLPLDQGTEAGVAAADGQMGCIMKLYRDWQLSGDDAMLEALWPKAKKAVEFCWTDGGWDADRDGVMEGCQHNTMDVEYFGPNPQMGGWYLGALRAAEEMARYLGDDVFADTCATLFRRGRAWIDEHLFNGDYYEHEIRPPASAEAIAPGLRAGMGADDLSDPALQLGAGCLVDQLVGQLMAHVAGLGYLLDRKHVRRTLKSILKHNRRTEFFSHFNHLRSYALGDERALLMASYPRGRRPARPFPYFNEVMTGFEYCAAVHSLYEGRIETGLQVIADIRQRYDGQRRNPFDEAECGHHYARAMASWAAVPALTGFRFSGVHATLEFAPREGLWFWSNGRAWGTCRLRRRKSGWGIVLTVLHGRLKLSAFRVTGVGERTFRPRRTLKTGTRATWRLRHA